MHWHGEYDLLYMTAFVAYGFVMACAGVAVLDLGVAALVRRLRRGHRAVAGARSDATARRPRIPRASWVFAGVAFLAVVGVAGSWPQVPCVTWDDADTPRDARCTLHEVRGALPAGSPLNAHWCSDVDPSHRLNVKPLGWALWLAHTVGLPLAVGLALGAWSRLWKRRLGRSAGSDPPSWP